MKKYLSFAAGAFGHDAFYNTLSLYFVMFVTSQLFATSDQAFNTRMIGYVTILMTIIRVVEIAFDPMIGGAVDNTSTRWGKFKPWLLIGTLTASVMLALIFSSFGGLATNKPMLYLVLFGIAFLTLDVLVISRFGQCSLPCQWIQRNELVSGRFLVLGQLWVRKVSLLSLSQP